jgi:tetratricopeptide (TPR) repeat protein
MNSIASGFWLLVVLTVIEAVAGPSSAAEGIENRLLSGTALFSQPIDVTSIPDPGILDTDAEMRAFVAEQVGDAKSGREKLRRLLGGMFESGLLSLDYNQVETKTARQTFHDRVGNCISFTNLFVALGREAGLDVVYQIVDIPPLWYSESDLVILNNHINVLVNTKFKGRVAIDFNIPEFKGNYDSHVVSDDHAFALYYNNIAMDFLTDGDIENSFRYLKNAILFAPDIAAPWINLGGLYSRGGQPGLALAAYRIGLKIDPDNRSALTNIAHLYRSLGKDEVANRYNKRIRRYQKRNPYYHYYRARHAADNGAFDEALENLDRAIRIKDNEHQFYSLMGQINYQMGNREEAISNFARARDLAGFLSMQRLYAQKLELLGANHP